MPRAEEQMKRPDAGPSDSDDRLEVEATVPVNQKSVSQSREKSQSSRDRDAPRSDTSPHRPDVSCQPCDTRCVSASN
jgi:hypothetical protein